MFKLLRFKVQVSFTREANPMAFIHLQFWKVGNHERYTFWWWWLKTENDRDEHSHSHIHAHTHTHTCTPTRTHTLAPPCVSSAKVYSSILLFITYTLANTHTHTHTHTRTHTLIYIEREKQRHRQTDRQTEWWVNFCLFRIIILLVSGFVYCTAK